MTGVTAGKEDRYYNDLGRASDYILRCKDCKRLVLNKDLLKRGSCRCGNKRMAEVTTLSGWEWFKMRVGITRFPYRAQMLKEFSLER